MKPKFAVSLMCMDFFNIKYELDVFNNNADFYHVDIMDGHFCKNLSLSPSFVKACSSGMTLPIDAHLMTVNPNDWIDQLADAGTTYISVHAETINTDAFRTINHIKQAGCKVGIVLNPATPLEYIQHYIHHVDILTIMSVDVGYAGQPFIPEMVEKIKRAQELKDQNGYKYLIQVDGSCNKSTYAQLYGAGARAFVMGSTGLFGLDSDVQVAYNQMRREFAEETNIEL